MPSSEPPVRDATWALRREGERYYGRVKYVDPAFFEMFGFPFVSGDPATALSEPGSMAITEDLARRIFGDRDPLGETLEGPGGDPYTVTAVLKMTILYWTYTKNLQKLTARASETA